MERDEHCGLQQPRCRYVSRGDTRGDGREDGEGDDEYHEDADVQREVLLEYPLGHCPATLGARSRISFQFLSVLDRRQD